METETKTVAVQQALTVDDAFIIGRMSNGKVFAQEVFTAAELQEIVQQAYDRYGVLADPFDTPGSGSVEFPPEFDGFPGTYGWERESDDLLDALERAHNTGARA